MYCTECGVVARGKFCAACGTRTTSGAPDAILSTRETDAAIDWTQSCDYETLIGHPEVRERLTRSAANAAKRMSGEAFLGLCESMLGGLVPGVPLGAIAKIAQPLNTKLGFKTGKTRRIDVPLPIGAAIVESLCWLARSGRVLKTVRQQADGCVLDAELPSDLFAFAGTLTLSIARTPTGASVEGLTAIPGQWYDWGKSDRCLDDLVSMLGRCAAA
ncbi:MAG: hypothetical protein KF847_10635 [Pirellulales bacterium]|nr:hypothetical protein [Pirellulales bacterium]